MTAPRCSPEEAERRTLEIADRMARGDWDSRRDVSELAAAWDVAPRTVRDYSRMASRMLWANSADLQDLRSASIERLMILSGKAEDDREYAAAVKAIAEANEIAGTKRQKLELTGTGGAPLGCPPQIAAVWHKAETGDADALALVERWLSTGELPARKGKSESGSGQ